MNKGQSAYGEKRVRREERARKRELENIEKMKELRKQGFRYSSTKVPPRQQGL